MNSFVNHIFRSNCCMCELNRPVPFRCSRWFLHLRSAQAHPTVTPPSVATRRTPKLCRPLTTPFPRCRLWLPSRLLPAACTPTQPPPPSPQPPRPWSSCWAAAIAARDTPPMQQRTPRPPPLPPGGIQPAGRILSAVCCTPSRRPTSTSSALALLTLA